MTKKLSFIIIAIALIAVIALAAAFYPKLSENYVQETTAEQTEPQTITENLLTDETLNSVQNQKAPDFTVTDIDGNKVSLSDFAGKPVVLKFWATWCFNCEAEMPSVEEVYQKYGDEVVFLMVNQTDGYQDTVESASLFIKEKGYTFPIYFDTEFIATYAYGAYSIPRTFFIDQNGNLVDSHVGTMPESKLESLIDSIIKVPQ